MIQQRDSVGETPTGATETVALPDMPPPGRNRLLNIGTF